MDMDGGVIDLLQRRLAALHQQRKVLDREIDVTRRVLVEAQRVADEMPPPDAGGDVIAKNEDGDVEWVAQVKSQRAGTTSRSNGDRIVGGPAGGSAEPHRYGKSVRTITLDAMREQPRRAWSTADITKAVQAKVGELADERLGNNVRASLYAARKSGEVTRNRDNKYTLTGNVTLDPDPDPAGAQEHQAGPAPEKLQVEGGETIR